MSGPKLSDAELERLKQEQLEKERQEILRKLREAQSVYHLACDKRYALRNIAEQKLRQISEVYHHTVREGLEHILDMLPDEPVENIKSPQSYYDAAKRMEERLYAAEEELNAVLKQAEGRMEEDRKRREANVVYQTFQTAAGDQGSVIDVARVDFGYKETEPSIDEDENEKQEMVRRRKEKKELYEEYLALAAIMDREPQSEEDFSDNEMLRREIEVLRCEYREKDEMDYIADQINEVMTELGYGFVTSSVLTRKGSAETDFSLYQADEETGVAVYTDQTGAVMMRMTVLGDDPMISEEDREFSYLRQIDFCAGHAEIVEALAERGVYLKQRSYEEPDRKHTYKMRITEPGRISAEGEKTGRMEEKTDRRKRRRAGTKKMRAV